MSSLAPRRSQQGQALSEFVALAVVLVPLFILLPMVGKYQDIAHHTLMASRYVAFDATLRNERVNGWKPESRLAQEVRRRFFGPSQTRIKADDQAGDFEADRNALWVDPTGQPLIAQFDRDVVVSHGPNHAATHGQGFTPAKDDSTFPRHSKLGLPAPGIYQAHVSVALANLPAGIQSFQPFDHLNLTLTRSTALLLDSWSARGPADVQNALRDPEIDPIMGVSDQVQSAQNLAVRMFDGDLVNLPLVSKLSNIRGPRLKDVSFWQDVVPADRLR